MLHLRKYFRKRVSMKSKRNNAARKNTDSAPVDFVISWVDGNDPAWRKEKAAFQLSPSSASEKQSSGTDSQESRYRDWENLIYWFRSVEKYAPWVRKIHLITWGHVPQWLNCAAPKLSIVTHDAYIPKKYLPVFSSHPIELNLHRIPDLADQFVYFNDDFFLTAPVEPEDFFVNGLPCDSLEEKPLAFFGDYAGSGVMNSVNTNDLMFASRHFDRRKNRKQHPGCWYTLKDPYAGIKNLVFSILKDRAFFGMNIHHLPQAYRKRTFEEVWALEPDTMDATCSHRFRSQSDVSQVVFKYWQLFNGQFYPYNKHKYGAKFNVYAQHDQMLQAITSHQYKFICLNDSPDCDFETVKSEINERFEREFPEKSSFEL